VEVLCAQDLELPPEVAQPAVAASESAMFVAPTPGVPASQRWLQKGNLAAEHVAAGAFDSAMRLLNRCNS
jgi:coatomer protein complex subunit alpha (xenin)